VAKHIVEEGRIWEDLDISAPFTMKEFNQRVADTCDSMRLKFVQPRYVFDEFVNAGVLERWSHAGNKYWRFKFKIATLTELMGEAIGVPLESHFVFADDDYGANQSEFIGARPWRGSTNPRFRV
jgi:hypothetical protein